MTTDLTPAGSAAVRLAADVVRLKRERDRARGWAVALEQQVARVEALADEWAVEGPSLVRHAYGARDVHEGSTLEQCAINLRAALEVDQ